MKKFLIHLFGVFITLTALSEGIIWMFGLTSPSLQRNVVDGIITFATSQEGTMVYGNFGDIKSSFYINDQGYNSSCNYDEPVDGIKVALLGDSFIEGFHENHKSSIGRRIESILPHIVCHEYGHGNWNALNYLELMSLIKNDYEKIFIVCDSSDFFCVSPARDRLTTTGLKKIMKKSHFFRYLYYNRRIGSNSEERDEERDIIENQTKKIVDLQDLFPQNVVWIWRSGSSENIHRENSMVIEHKLKPYDFGKIDGHWNSNGRINCAQTIANYMARN